MSERSQDHQTARDRGALAARGAGVRGRLRHALAVALLAAAALGVTAAPALADGTETIPGSPLLVSIGTLGECQSNYLNAGNNFFPGSGTLGDCGFFLAFPEAGNPEALRKDVYGFVGNAGPGISTDYTAVSQLKVTGSGTEASPYTQVTTFAVVDAESKKAYALITETTTYINGQPQFTSTFAVENITGKANIGELEPAKPAQSLSFHAIYAGDLYTDNSDFGTGVFLGGPPHFVGGQNTKTGVFGGFIESTPWTNWQTGCWNETPESRCEPHTALDGGIWHTVRNAALSTGPVFNNDIDPNLIDNAAGVSWDNHLTVPLKSGETASYTIINRAQIPAGLSVQPTQQTLTSGQTATIKVQATDSAGTPYGGRPLVYNIGGANPQSGKVMTDAGGNATISYVGTAAGLDTVQMFLDLEGTGKQTTADPASAAQVTWLPNSGYSVQSVKANSDGSITITFVPVQAGQASVVVTVPTASIAKKCRKGLVKIKGKCREPNTVTGKVVANGIAGTPLKITVKPNSKVKGLLKKGRTVSLTATLTYTSAFGGSPTVKVYHLKVKPKKKRK